MNKIVEFSIRFNQVRNNLIGQGEKALMISLKGLRKRLTG